MNGLVCVNYIQCHQLNDHVLQGGHHPGLTRMLKKHALQRNLPGLIRMLKQHALQRNLPGLFPMLQQHALQHVIIQLMIAYNSVQCKDLCHLCQYLNLFLYLYYH
jgi:hypothetical protein